MRRLMPQRVFLRVLLLPVLLSLLAGCSYRPLYGTNANGSSVVAALSQVAVDEQKTRAGQLVRNELISSLGGGNGTARYVLHLVPVETTSDVSSSSTQKLYRKRYKLSVKYTLTDVKSGNSVTSGTSFSNVSFDTVEQQLADLQASDNAQLRAAQEVSEDIRTRLAAVLSAGQT
jgi:LPS-assembly lipoprotein